MKTIVANEVAALMSLRTDVWRLRRIGHDLGLSEEDLDKIIEEALSDIASEEKLANVNLKQATNIDLSFKLRQKVYLLTKLWLISVAFVLGVIALLYIGFQNSKTIERQITSTLIKHQYLISRNLRLLTLPLHDYFNISSDFYHGACLVSNPFYLGEHVQCSQCLGVSEVPKIFGEIDGQSYIEASKTVSQPLIIKEEAGAMNVSYDMLKALYSENKAAFDRESVHIESNLDGIQTWQDVFGEKIEELIANKKPFELKIIINSINSVHQMRKLFPRLNLIPQTSEIGFDKLLYIDGVKSPSYTLGLMMYDNMAYLQAHGSRRILISPVEWCENTCDIFMESLEPGDVLLYDHRVWRIHMLPSYNDISVGYLRTFS